MTNINDPLKGIGFDDFDFSVSNLTQQAGGKPDKDFDEDEWLFDDNSTETVVGSRITLHTFQIDLKDEQTEILWYPHIHWMQEGANEPAWQLRYKLCPAGEAEGSWVTIAGSTPEFTYVSGALHQISVLPAIDVTGLLNTAVEVKVQISRLGASDSYVGDARFMGFDFHTPRDQTMGSRQEFIK
jgi:hypothetical protein